MWWSAAEKWPLDPPWHRWSCWYHCNTNATVLIHTRRRNSRNTLYSGDRVIAVPLTQTCECWAPLRRCSQTSRSPSSSLCWSTFLWWAWSAWQRTSPTGRSVSSYRDRLQSDSFSAAVAGCKSKQGSRGDAIGVLYGICRMKRFDPRHFTNVWIWFCVTCLVLVFWCGQSIAWIVHSSEGCWRKKKAMDLEFDFVL